MKRSVEWLNKAPMDCCVKSEEVEPGVRVTDGHVVLRQAGQGHTDHHHYRIESSVV